MYFELWLISRWRLPATPCFSLPVAVSLKRFLTPLLVLSLGIFVSLLPARLCRGRRFQPDTAALTGRPGCFSNDLERGRLYAAERRLARRGAAAAEAKARSGLRLRRRVMRPRQ